VNRLNGSSSRHVAIFISGCVLFFLSCSSVLAETNPGWGRWWLPPARSEHGPAIDNLFYWIFWITMIAFVAVELVLVIFLIQYRSRPERKKAHFTHGNTRLEMAWTLAPAIILAGLALGSKKVWDNYRYSPTSDDPNRATLLLIGQQFKWNIIYPGPDGKLGRYMLYPKPYDAKWPVGKDGKDVMYLGVPGPASLPYDQAVRAINKYIDDPTVPGAALGKDFTDPDGADDDFQAALGRELVIPARRPIEVQLSSKDVIHDFFLPNFRVKLDAVPGMRGHLYFTATTTSAEYAASSRKKYTIAELESVFRNAPTADYKAIISETENTPGAENYKPQRGPAYWRYKDKDNRTIVANAKGLNADIVGKLKAAGVTEIYASESGAWELVCEELCGLGHNTMTAPLIVLSNEEYDARRFDKPWKAAPSTAPATAPSMAMR
jgi:heme/copper-type cytochrome/quinol oxidase subunit 2